MPDFFILTSMWLLRVAGGQNTSFILARPNEKFSDLPRHPYEVNPPDICVVCDQDNGDDDSPLECDKVGSLIFTSYLYLLSNVVCSATTLTI